MADKPADSEKTKAELDQEDKELLAMMPPELRAAIEQEIKEDEELLASLPPELRAVLEKLQRGEAVESFPVDWEALIARLPPEDRVEIEMIARGEHIPGSQPLDLDALRHDIEERTKKKT